MTPGQEVKIGDYVIRHNALAVTDDGRKQMVTADMTVLRNGVEITKMYPARWFFRKHEDQPTTEVAIRRTLAEDLYIVMPQFDASQQSANVEITVNPLVNWVWLGFGLLAFGTFIALLPEAAFTFAVAQSSRRGQDRNGVVAAAGDRSARSRAGAGRHAWVDSSTRRRCSVMPRGESSACAARQDACAVRSTTARCARPATATTRRSRSCSNTSTKARARTTSSRRSSRSTAARCWPSRPADSAPLSWLLPYGLAALGLLALVVTARRWSSRPAAAGAGGADMTVDPAIDARLDDELRDLD